MLDWLRSDSDESGNEESSPGEDLLEGSSWEEGDEELDEFGAFDDEGDEGDDLDELINRVDEFEEELGTLSSTVNTLEHENEEIGDDVAEVMDNVRKLLEIYEMVTRGVNPFSDEDPLGEDMSEGALDLFGNEEGGTDEVIEDEFDDGDDLLDDEFDEMEEFEMSEDDGVLEEEDGASETPEDGRSFDELKEEFEDGDDIVSDDVAEEAVGDEPDLLEEDLDEAELTGQDSTEDEPDTAAGDRSSYGYDAPADGNNRAGVLGEKPYLRELPKGYTTDLIVMQWLSKLDNADEDESAADTIEYYRAIGWISNQVADELQSYAPGLAPVDFEDDLTPSSSLPYESHKRSLRYIHHLATTSSQQIVLTEAPETLDDVLDFDGASIEDPAGANMSPTRTDGGGEERDNDIFDGWAETLDANEESQ